MADIDPETTFDYDGQDFSNLHQNRGTVEKTCMGIRFLMEDTGDPRPLVAAMKDQSRASIRRALIAYIRKPNMRVLIDGDPEHDKPPMSTGAMLQLLGEVTEALGVTEDFAEATAASGKRTGR